MMGCLLFVQIYTMYFYFQNKISKNKCLRSERRCVNLRKRAEQPRQLNCYLYSDRNRSPGL